MDRLIPFTPDVYVGMFADYNMTIWPGHLVGLAFMWTMVICARRGGRANTGIVLTIIAGLWIWVGYKFHLEHYAQLNWAAVTFGWVFIAQGLLIFVWGTVAKTVEVRVHSDKFSVLGLLLMLASIALHPMFAYAAGFPIAAGQTAGMVPLSLIMLSFSGFALLVRRPPLWVVMVPLLWCAWEAAWSWTLGLWPDYTSAFVAMVGGLLCALPRPT